MDKYPSRPLRRSEAARGDRARDHPQPGAARRRRARLDARHERAGEDPRADARAQARARPHLPLHHPRPRDGEVLLRPDRDHVPRPDRRDRARPRRSTRIRSIRTRRRCCGRSPSPIRAAACRATCRAARCPTRRGRRSAARSTRAARRRSRSAAGRRATSETCSRRAGRSRRRSSTRPSERRSRTSRRSTSRASDARLARAKPAGRAMCCELLSRRERMTRTSRSGAACVGWTPSTSASSSSGSSPSTPRPLDVGDVKVECHLYDETALAEAEARRATREQVVRGRSRRGERPRTSYLVAPRALRQAARPARSRRASRRLSAWPSS